MAHKLFHRVHGLIAEFNTDDELMIYADEHGYLQPARSDEGGYPYAVLRDEYFHERPGDHA